MNTKPEMIQKKLTLVEQRFVAHNSQPEEGQGFISFSYEDNRKECLCELSDTIVWEASLVLKAFSGEGIRPNPEEDLLLMEAEVAVEGEFLVGEKKTADDLQSLTWYFDDVCRYKLLSKMRLLLLDTEFAQLPLPRDF